MKFNYKARTEEGEIKIGTVEAANREAAVVLLQKYRLFITSLERISILPFWAKKLKIPGRSEISGKEIVMFSRQLSILFKANVPLIAALQTLALQTRNQVFSEKILKITEKVEGGMSLSQALSSYPKIFSPFYISMAKSGEASGTLSKSLNYLAEHLEKEYYLSSKVKGAMLYPAFVLFVLLVIFTIIIFFVLPQLIPILEQIEELPIITKVVIVLGDFLKTKGWIIIPPFLVLIILLLKYIKTPEGKEIFDRISIRLPVVGGFIKLLSLTRFAENLSTLIAGGLPIATALGITGEIVGNTVYKGIILETQTEVRRGTPISLVLRRFPEQIPPMFVQMTVVGEKSGRLDSALMNIVTFYRKEVDMGLDRILGLLEPVLIVVLGALVGGFIASIFLPLYQMGGM